MECSQVMVHWPMDVSFRLHGMRSGYGSLATGYDIKVASSVRSWFTGCEFEIVMRQ